MGTTGLMTRGSACAAVTHRVFHSLRLHLRTGGADDGFLESWKAERKGEATKTHSIDSEGGCNDMSPGLVPVVICFW